MSGPDKKRRPKKRPRRAPREDRKASKPSRKPTDRTKRSASSNKTLSSRTRKAPAKRSPAKRRPPQRGLRPTRPSFARKEKGETKKGWRIARIAAIVFALMVALLAIGGGLVYAAMSRDLPDLDHPLKGRDQTSKIYDRDGRLIAELFAEENRTRVPLADIPVHLRNAVIATEDERFYEHQGVDPIGILRALWVDVLTRSVSQGGSTITQQYVVNTFVDREDTIARKVKEAILAYRLEKDHTKDEILGLYLNTIYFGHGAYSVETAAQVYFEKHVTELSLVECATLAAVIKSPATYSPYLDPEASRTRRGIVLGQMLDQGHIDEAQCEEAKAAELTLVGLEQESAVAPYFLEYVKAILAEEYGAEAVYRGGLEVRTTLDLDAQAAAEAAVARALDREDDPSAALVALNPRTGEILAMVGGRDFSIQQFNVAVQGRRQPGSAFKPFVLVTALEQDIHSEQTYESGSVTLPIKGSKDWNVTGAYGGRTGPMRLREATERSVNSIFAQLILEIGADRVVETAGRMGITSDIMAVPAIALGGLDKGVSPLEMASAYGTLANGGIHATPFAILEVKDGDGDVVSVEPSAASQALDPAVAYLATDMLRGVITRGTGRAAAIGRPAAGKTGTTQEYRDAWFAGYTPQISATVWVGYPAEQREMKDVHGRRVTGGSFPAEIWADFMKAALTDVPEEDFVKPGGLTSLTICLESGEQATEYCEDTGTGLFLSGTVPGDCGMHTGPIIVDLPNLIGKTKEEAIALLNQLLLLFEIDERDVDDVPAGIVAEQDPAGGSRITTDTVVIIVVSTGNTSSQPPVALFVFLPEGPMNGTPVEFDASSSVDDGAIVTWYWEFGDGDDGEGEQVSHVFATAGEYEVTLWVTDDEDQVDSITLTVTVE